MRYGVLYPCVNKFNNNKTTINTMIANSNIDFLTLKNTSVSGILPAKFVIWLYAVVFAQPLLSSLLFWLASEELVMVQRVENTVLGFMFGVAMVIIWMSYDSGFFRALSQCIYKCKVYNRCHQNVHTFYNHLDSVFHFFWVFIAPPLSVVGVIVYSIATLLLALSSVAH